MKTTGNPDDPKVDTDPDFNDPLGDKTASIDPDGSEFRDEVLVSNYTQAGALQSELETERRETEQATLEALEAMRAMDAGDQVKWRISRSGADSDELNGYLETWPNHQMTIERLRDKFGGGTYYCKGFRKGRYFSHQTLQISGEAKRKPSGVEGMNQSVPVSAAPQFDMQGFLTAQERREERRREDERRERLERQERDEKRDEKRMQLLLTLGPAAITALGGLFQGRQTDLAPLIAALKPPDPLTMMTQLKALQGNGQDGMLNKVLPMLIDMAGSRASGGDTGWLDVIKEFAKGAGPAVGGLIEANLKAAQAPSNPPPQLALPSPQNLPPPPPSMIVVPESQPRKERRQRSVNGLPLVEPEGSMSAPAGGPAAIAGSNSPSRLGDPDMNLFALMRYVPWLREQLARMLGAAHKRRDPEVYAALLLEELPDGLDPQVVGQLLSREDWFQQVCQMEPRWNDAQVYPWIEYARNLIVQSVTSEPPTLATVPTPAPARVAKVSGEVDRPTKMPSLTGD